MTKTLCLAVLLAAPAAAGASDRGWMVGNDTIHLRVADLDLHAATGRAALLARVEAAAERLCRDRVDDCVARTVRATTDTSVRIALAERAAIRVAAR